MNLAITLRFGKPGFIASPYWPEMFRLIEIQKKSGMNRVRNEKKIREALESYLKTIGLSFQQYQDLEKLAARPFHVNGKGTIYIPAANVYACLVNTCAIAPKRIQIGNLRTALRISDLQTTKTGPDGTFDRFAVVTSSQGKLSNQRGFRSNPYICDFDATGSIEHDEGLVKQDAIMDLLVYAGREVGIGASRKMGYGRFQVIR